MSALLDLGTADRLAKLCGMFSSDHAGERAAAAAKADALIRALGLTWQQVFLPKQLAVVAGDHEDETPTVEDLIDFAIAHGEGIVTNWEWGFLNGIRDWPNSLTAKQRRMLEAIVAKLSARRAA